MTGVQQRTTPRRRPGHRLGPPAVGGLAASTLVVVGGGLAGAAGPAADGLAWSPPPVPVDPTGPLVISLVAYYGGLVLLVRSWLSLRRLHLEHRFAGQGLTIRAVALVGCLWALPMLVGPPLASRDVYAYGAQGRMVAEGLDVYAGGPSAMAPNDPALAPIDPLYLDAPAPYGPVFVWSSARVVDASQPLADALPGGPVVMASLLFRLLATIGLVVAAWAVVVLARRSGRDPVDALVLVAANPLVLLHLVSGAHNEALMVAVLMVGLVVAHRGLLLAGAVVCAVAASIKLPALLAAAFLGWAWAAGEQRIAWRALRLVGAGLVVVGTLSVAGQVTGWGWGWVEALLESDPVDAYLSITRLVGGAIHLVTGLDAEVTLSASRLAGLALAVGLSAGLLLRPHLAWLSALGWSLVVFAVLHPTTQPWYLIWGLFPLAAIGAGARNRFLVGVSAALTVAVMPTGPLLGLDLVDSTGLAAMAGAAVALVLLTLRPAGRPGRAGPVGDRGPGGGERQGVSIIVPTRHEIDNIEPLVAAVDAVAAASPVLAGRRVEVVFADDSDDATPEAVRRAAAADRAAPVTVKLVHRRPEVRWGGLGGAVVDGLEASHGAVAVVMDGDLQHPASSIPDLVEAIDAGAGLAPASRRVPGGSDGEGLTALRLRLSRAASLLAQVLFPSSVGPIADPLSGFFAVDVQRIDLDRLQPDGFKILVELAATHPDLDVEEVPFRFAGRTQGVSKASASEGLRYLGHLVDLRMRTSGLWSGAPIPQRVFTVGAVGG